MNNIFAILILSLPTKKNIINISPKCANKICMNFGYRWNFNGVCKKCYNFVCKDCTIINKNICVICSDGEVDFCEICNMKAKKFMCHECGDNIYINCECKNVKMPFVDIEGFHCKNC